MAVKLTIVKGATTYRLSTETTESGGSTWQGKIQNSVELEAKARKSVEERRALKDQTVEILNLKEDGTQFIDTTGFDLWGAVLTLEITGVPETWSGTVKSWNQTGAGVLVVRAMETALQPLKKLLPDEVCRLIDLPDASRGTDTVPGVGTTIPTVFGGSATDPVRVRAILADRVNFRFIVCVGEIRQIVTVYKDREAIATGFNSYLGSAGQGTYPGIAYIQFTSDPRDDAGRWPEIFVDVVGLKLGAHTEAECRNPARVAQYLLTTAATGTCGWGLGVSSGEVDIAGSFATAIADCDALGLKLDGALFTQKEAAEWLPEVERAMRGEIFQAQGIWKARVDKDSASVATFTSANMVLLDFGQGDSGDRKNKHILDYRYDVADQTWLGQQVREDATSQGDIGLNEQRIEAPLIRDHTTAGIICDYLNKFAEYSEVRIEFRTRSFSGVQENSVITITYPGAGLSSSLFRVENIRYVENGQEAIIEARSYSSHIFDTVATTTTADPPLDPIIPGPESVAAPADPSGLSTSTGTKQQADGTTIAYIDGVYVPNARTLFVKVEVGVGVSPVSWVELGNTVDGTWHFEPAKPGETYTFRLTAVNTGGSSNQVTTTTVAGGDTTAPGTPGTPTLEVLFKSIRIRSFQNPVKAPDLAGFRIYRHTSNDSGGASEIGFVDCAGNQDGVTFLDTTADVATTYFYWTRAVDRTGNLSGFSAVASAATAPQITTGQIATGAISASTMFAAGVVDAAAIAALAVGTDELANNAVTADKIYANAVTAGKIAAGAVTTEKLYVAPVGASLTADPNVSDSTAWVASFGSGSIQTVTDGKVGTTVWRSSTANNWEYSAKAVPVDPNKTYRMRGWYRRPAGDGTLYFAVILLDANGDNISGDGTWWYYPVSGAVPTSAWTEGYGLFGAGTAKTIPSNARSMRVGFILNYSGSTPGDEVQDIRIEEAIPGTLIQDGAITTDKLLANAVTAGKIASGQITTSHLAAAGISADCITTGVLDAICICGVCAYICTGTVGGWSMDSTKLYSGSGLGGGLNLLASNSTTGSGYFYSNNQILQGFSQTWHYSDNAGHLVLGQIAASPNTVKTGFFGLQMMDHLGCEYFALATRTGASCREQYNRIGGWSFTSDCLFSGNLVLGSSGFVSGCYAASTGWCLGADGTLKFGGSSSPKLSWNGSTLAIDGTLTASAGSNIAGWTTDSTYMASPMANGGRLVLSAGENAIYACATTGIGSYAMLGRMYQNSAFTSGWGVSITDGLTGPFAAALGFANTGTVTLPSTTVVAQGCPFFYVGSGSSAFLQYYNGAVCVQGTLTASAGSNIAGWVTNSTEIMKVLCDGSNAKYASMYSDAPSLYVGCNCAGIGWTPIVTVGAIYDGAWRTAMGIGAFCWSGGVACRLFELSTRCNSIAGWNFDSACLYSGNLLLKSAGSIEGCYSAGSTGWCIGANGAAEFNNVTVRGTVDSCCGFIGGWCLASNCFYRNCTDGFGNSFGSILTVECSKIAASYDGGNLCSVSTIGGVLSSQYATIMGTYWQSCLLPGCVLTRTNAYGVCTDSWIRGGSTFPSIYASAGICSGAAIEAIGSGYAIGNAGIRMGLYAATYGYIQTPPSGCLVLWNNGTCGIAVFNNDLTSCFLGMTCVCSSFHYRGDYGSSAKGASATIWMGTSGANAYIEAGNAAWNASVPLLLTGYNAQATCVCVIGCLTATGCITSGAVACFGGATNVGANCTTCQIIAKGCNGYSSLLLGTWAPTARNGWEGYDGMVASTGADLNILAGKGVCTECHNIAFFVGCNGAGGIAECRCVGWFCGVDGKFVSNCGIIVNCWTTAAACAIWACACTHAFIGYGTTCAAFYGSSCYYTMMAYSTGNVAVYGQSGAGYGVYGWACTGFGVYGCTPGNCGVYGRATCEGVFGYATSDAAFRGYAGGNFGMIIEAVGNYGVYATAAAYPVSGNGAYDNRSSSRYLKLVRGEEKHVLEALRQIKVYRFAFHDRNQSSLDEHIGVMEDDFRDVFSTRFQEGIYSESLAGVAVAGVKELHECVERQKECISKLETQLSTYGDLEARLAAIERRLAA